MTSPMRLIATAGLAMAIGLSACGSDPDPGADAVTSTQVTSADSTSRSTTEATEPPPASTSQRDVGDSGTALEALTTYADDWSIALTEDQVACLADNLDEEFRSAGGSLDEVGIPFFLVGCGVNVGVASGGDGRSPLEAVVAVLLIDEDVELTDDTVTCATEALVAGFGAEGFVDLLIGVDEPTPDDDAIAEAAFDSCGLDGAAIVGG